MSNEVEFEYTGKEEREEVPRDVTIVRFHSSVTEVAEDIFKGCKQLKKVVLNDGLQKIGNHSFYYCSKLEHINFPFTLIEVGASEFCGGAMKNIVLNEGLMKIGVGAFRNCTLLESITIPSTITEIWGHTFAYCRNLRSVGLHEGIQSIHYRAFGNCPSLERFMFPNLSYRLDAIMQTGQYADVENKIDNIRGLVERRGSIRRLHLVVQRRGSELFVSDVIWVQSPNWIRTRGILGQIDQLLTYYELREATTLLELAMWKAKMDQVEENLINLDVYRIDIPGPVRDTILQYLNFRV